MPKSIMMARPLVAQQEDDGGGGWRVLQDRVENIRSVSPGEDVGETPRPDFIFMVLPGFLLRHDEVYPSQEIVRPESN